MSCRCGSDEMRNHAGDCPDCGFNPDVAVGRRVTLGTEDVPVWLEVHEGGDDESRGILVRKESWKGPTCANVPAKALVSAVHELVGLGDKRVRSILESHGISLIPGKCGR